MFIPFIYGRYIKIRGKIFQIFPQTHQGEKKKKQE